MRRSEVVFFAVVSCLKFSISAMAAEAPENGISTFPTPVVQAASKAAKMPRKTISLKENMHQEERQGLANISNSPIVVTPEIPTVVPVNAQDVNRIICPAEIKDIVSLEEKGVGVKITGKDAFINFRYGKKGEKTIYATEPTEMYVICGDATYNLILHPKMDVPPQTVRLSSGLEKKIRENSELLGGLPFEKKVMRVVKDAYTDQLAESYSITNIKKSVGSWQELSVIHTRNIDIEGEGLRVREFEILLKQGQVPFKLSEKIFTKKPFAENPVAVSLEKHVVKPGEIVRGFVVEQRQEKLASSLYRDTPARNNLNPLDDELVEKIQRNSSDNGEQQPNKVVVEEEAEE